MPSPLATLTKTVTAIATTPSSAAADASAFVFEPHLRASAIPTNPSASRDGILIVDDSAISVAPASSSTSARPRIGSLPSTARNASSTPASMRPIISASLWIPATRWNSTSGFAAPSQRALTLDTPQRRASRGSAHTIIATPARARRRCRKIPATMLSPVSQVIPRPIQRNSGPYGAGVSRQMLGTVRVRTWSTPSAPAGPISYGSSPRAVISLWAR